MADPITLAFNPYAAGSGASIPVCIVGQTFTTTLVSPPQTVLRGQPLGARVEEPITHAIISAYHQATLNGSTWTVTLDSPLQAGSYDLVWMTPDSPPSYIAYAPLTCVTAGQATGALPDWPAIDQVAIRPDIDSVARLLRTRTKMVDGTVKPTFDATTIVKDTEVTATILDAEQLILSQLPVQLDPELYPRIKYAVTLQAAILVESSFFRTQEGNTPGATGLIPTYSRLLAATMSGLGTATGRYVGLS